MAKLLIHLDKIKHNAKHILSLLKSKNISLMAVTKVFSGDLNVAETLVEAGVKYLGDSRIRNIVLMKNHDINAKFILIRIPAIHEIPDVVSFTDYSVHSEIKTIKILDKQARIQNKVHKIILMVDSGDLREGISQAHVYKYIDVIRKLPNIRLKGIATNLKCFGGVIPDEENMSKFSRLAEKIEDTFDIRLEFVSAGNSANFQWLNNTKHLGRINNLRIGEALFFGWETIDFQRLKGLYTNNALLKAQIVEIKERNTVPQGKIHSNAFGEKVTESQSIFGIHTKKKKRTQMLLNVGRQDVDINGLTPIDPVKILGASSDYLIVTPIKENTFSVGKNIRFRLNYSALMRLTISPYIDNKYVKKKDKIKIQNQVSEVPENLRKYPYNSVYTSEEEKNEKTDISILKEYSAETVE